MNQSGRVYIVILNWNGWHDTIECLESVLRNDYPDYRVIVCDNDSSDGSLEHIKEWAEGGKPHSTSNTRFKRLAEPPVPKPVSCVEYHYSGTGCQSPPDDRVRLILLRTGANLGFAGGNNVGLRYLLTRNDWKYVWLLNNDTVIESNALSEMVARMRETPEAGMCGSTLMYYHDPDIIWALGGGSFSRWNAQSKCISNGKRIQEMRPREEVEAAMRFVAGASLLVSRRFIDTVGLMCEEYFLYFEEPDWAFRAWGLFPLVYAPNSIVYHKVGVSTSAVGTGRNSWYVFRNQLLFARKFFPWFLPTTFVWAFLRQVVCGFFSLCSALRKRFRA